MELAYTHVASPAKPQLRLACADVVKYSLTVEFVIPPFEPHLLLRNGHAMTIASALLPRRFDIPPAEARLFQVESESCAGMRRSLSSFMVSKVRAMGTMFEALRRKPSTVVSTSCA